MSDNQNLSAKSLCLQTLAMLEPILQEKQFALANVKMQKILGKIKPEDFDVKSKELDLQIYSLQKRIVREVDVLGKLKG